MFSSQNYRVSNYIVQFLKVNFMFYWGFGFLNKILPEFIVLYFMTSGLCRTVTAAEPGWRFMRAFGGQLVIICGGGG